MNAEDHNASSVPPSAIAARLMQTYRARNALLGADLFHTVPWEILLMLEIAEDGLTEDELRRSAGAPPAPMRRWLDVLCGRGLVSRTIGAEEQDLYALTAKAKSGLAEILLSA